MDNNINDELATAQQYVQQYGQILAMQDGSSYGLPVSLLPCDKDQLKAHIQLLLWEIGEQDKTICNSLAQSYVYLAQFITDDEADIVTRGQAVMQSSDMGHDDWQLVEDASRIINQIKLEMEALMAEVKPFI